MRAAVSAGVIALTLVISSPRLTAQQAGRPVFDERAPCAALDAACEQMAEMRAEASRGLPWGTVPGQTASLFRSDSLRQFGQREMPSAAKGGSRAELRRVVDTREERRVIRLEWRYDNSPGDGRSAKEYAEADIDSATGAWLSARWVVDDPAGKFVHLSVKTGPAACVSWTRPGDIRVLVGGKLAKTFSPIDQDSMKWLPWPVAVLSYLASGDAAAYSTRFVTPLWDGADTVSSVPTHAGGASILRWKTSLGDWSARQGPAEDELILSGGLTGSGTGEEMEKRQHDHFRSNVLDALMASCP